MRAFNGIKADIHIQSGLLVGQLDNLDLKNETMSRSLTSEM